jgi:hypothetical protein
MCFTQALCGYLTTGLLKLNANSGEAKLFAGDKRASASQKRIKHDAARWRYEPNEILHEVQRLNGWMGVAEFFFGNIEQWQRGFDAVAAIPSAGFAGVEESAGTSGVAFAVITVMLEVVGILTS